jgi:hypothetical protein
MIKELFSEKGDVSMMRLIALICTCTASFIAIYSTIKGMDLNAASVICGVFLGAGISGKIMQKRSEVSNDRQKAR